MAGKTVCVTGGSGYIASWLVKKLLERAYTVRASVRDPNDAKRTAHLRALAGAKERLHLFKADLLDEGSFDDGIKGCDGVFHCASPFFLQSSNPEEELIEPALKGTVNVLGSCSRSPSVKRVILTSSEAAIAFNRTPKTAETVIDESWWSDPEYLRENQNWYVLSKTLAERAAWDFVKDKGIDLVSINPCCVIGPMLQPTLKESCSQILGLINTDTCLNLSYGWVHVFDVVDAHILAYEKPEANGRYYVVERCANRLDLANMLRKMYPDMKFAEKCADGKPPVMNFKVNNEKAKKLGVVFTPLEQALKDTVESLKEKGFIKV